MSRKLKPLTSGDIAALPTTCSSCVFWESERPLERRCGVECDEQALRTSISATISDWGECGKVAYEDDVLLGFVKYAPSRYFPQAATFASRPLDPDVPLIACLHVAPEARHHGLGSVLLRAAMRDLGMRGERRIEAFAAAKKPAAIEESPVMSIDFLLRNGFTVSRPDPDFPLMMLELKSLAVITENLEAVFDSLRFPLRIPKRAPASWMKGR